MTGFGSTAITAPTSTSTTAKDAPRFAALFSFVPLGQLDEVIDLVLPDPTPGQVRVRVASAGMCHIGRHDGDRHIPILAT